MNNEAPHFELLLKNEKVQQYDRMAVLFTFLNLVFFTYLAFSSEELFPRVTSGAGSLFMIILLAAWFFTKEKTGRNRAWLLHTAGLLICLSWMLLQQWWLLLLSLGILVLYIISKRKLVVSVTRERIRYPSFPEKIISWPELTQVILKDGLLTLNFSSDRFIQQLVDPAGTTVDEQEFNEFCRQQAHT